jgi:molybdopterin adenylyltransferase
MDDHTPRLNLAHPFKPVRIALLTVSDTREAAQDSSGDILAQRLQDAGHRLADRRIVRDEVAAIQGIIKAWIAEGTADAIIATGGTGLTGRDVTPEAFEALYEKKIDGFGEMFRMLSYQSIGTSALQSRATAGLAQGVYLFALPGSNGACRDGWDHILRWQLDSRHRPCNLVELMPRLRER